MNPNSKKKPVAPLDEVAVLFPEEQIGPYTVRPWTLVQFGNVLPVLVEMVSALQPLGLNFENCERFLKERIFEIAPTLIPFLPRLIAVTLRVEELEVEGLGFDDGLLIGVTILAQNAERLKNLLPRLLKLAGAGASAILSH